MPEEGTPEDHGAAAAFPLWRRLLMNKEHPVLQFIKYGIAGGLASGVDATVFYLLAWLLIPALSPTDPFVRIFGLDVEPISEAVRLRHYWIDKTIAFLFSNFTAYLMNIFFVFRSGRHKRHHELMMFYGAAILSFLIGTWLGGLLIEVGFETTYSYIGAVVAAVLINFTCRKFFIFHG